MLGGLGCWRSVGCVCSRKARAGLQNFVRHTSRDMGRARRLEVSAITAIVPSAPEEQKPKEQKPKLEKKVRRHTGQVFKKRRKKNVGPRLMDCGKVEGVPKIDALVVVEGYGDFQIVKRAVQAEKVLVCDGTSVLNKKRRHEIKEMFWAFKNIILFMDPDTEGRRMRTQLDLAFGPCQHAFLPVIDAIKRHEKKGVALGIEHATPQAVQHALINPTSSDKSRHEVIFDELEAQGLVQGCGARGSNVRLRRELFCGVLGIGFCDGGQLVKQINRYGFTQQHLEDALQWTDKMLKAFLAENREQKYGESALLNFLVDAREGG